MREIQILHQMLIELCPNIHKKRLNSLMVATTSLLDGDKLSLSELGRNITSRVSAKHCIKRMDRLLGNHHLNSERLAIYQWHARQICGANPMPVVLVDWVDVREQLRMFCGAQDYRSASGLAATLSGHTKPETTLINYKKG